MRRFLALSRVQHIVLDLGMPAFCILLWLGKFPPLVTTVLCLLTGFAGYTAVYALNDLLGVQSDREKFKVPRDSVQYSVEATDCYHPIAQGLLSMKAGIWWTSFWFLIAVGGGYVLMPRVVLILLVGGLCEILYCLLLKITAFRIFVSGVVKTCGPVAAIFAVDPSPSFWPFLLLIIFVFLWEIGGQNIPADSNDVEDDRRSGAKTVPVQWGVALASRLSFIALIGVVFLSFLLPFITPVTLTVCLVLNGVIGFYLLIKPALLFFRHPGQSSASALFDKASYYPLYLAVAQAATLMFSDFLKG